ncbi:hypothetical protein [Pseudomonas poae]|uniref:Autotransporter outer membrane beta-barrel domain-containing protein n=1 Tax=Pseudomonas poae TaxID=200451 RepID=A0ABY0RGB8_9PSED|nr:hypothetical protein [Pseudomonas poae]KRP53389.1 hypothetical protein TU75_05050 [Pseudomonas poae]SDO02686.1 hypothetical protein SAMN04490208_2290 [Pseudomonas poae]
MNGVSAAQTYRSVDIQPPSQSGMEKQQQEPNSVQRPRALTAAYTANVLGGQASFQPIPTLAFRPKTYLTLSATANLIPGLVSAGASKTIRFDPLIRVSPTDTGGVTVGFTPRLEVELSGAVRAGLTNIFNTGLGVNGGLGGAQKFTFGAPQFSANLEPNGVFSAHADLNPTLGSEQTVSANIGAGFGVGAISVGANQSFSHSLGQQIKAGGPGVQFQLSSTGQPKISTNWDRTVSISNSYTFSPKANLNGQISAGQVDARASLGAGPSFTIEHNVIFNTDPARKAPPRHEFSARSGVSVDGSFGFRVSLLPSGSPLNISAEVGFNPGVSVSGGGRYTL